MRRLLFLAPAALFVLMMTAFVFGLHHDPAQLTSVLIDKPLPAFDLPSVRPSDAGLKSADFRGQPMLLNVFASWCVSCRQEHGLLLAMKQAGVRINGLDWKDDAAAGAQYLRNDGDPYILAGNDRNGRAGIDLGVAAVPETFIIDAAGKVRYKFIGPMAEEDWNKTIRPLLERLKSPS
jgi:cytochrome c biogenesis protein CcmG/thiol:disulfide interchange protein DsbE